MQFNNLFRPKTLEEAARYASMQNTVVLGGAMWLRMQRRKYENAVDLSALSLDKIEETQDGIRIGAYVTLRELEESSLLKEYTKNAIKTALSPIVGVQFRNTATLGGSICGRFGFSDVTALFCALGASVLFVNKGLLSLTEFVEKGASHDVLAYLILPKKAPDDCVSLAHRVSATDFPLVTVCVARRGDEINVTASPVPLRAKAKIYSVNDTDIIDNYMSLFEGKEKSEQIKYREHITRVLISRALGGIR